MTWSNVFWSTAGLLVYTQVVYPLMMSVVGALSRLYRPQENTKLPPLSLLIAAFNEDSVIEDKINNALAVDYPRDWYEILVGSDASTDRTNEIVRRMAGEQVRVFLFLERRGKASVLNDLVKHATGKILVFCDANVMFRADALRKMVVRLADERIGAVSGDVRLASYESDFGEGESLYYKVERAIQLGESRIGSVMGVDGGMYAQRRELFRPLPADALNEEFGNSMNIIRQGYRVVYEPSAVATENGTPRARDEFRRRIRVAAGTMQSIKRGQWPPLRRPVELWQYVSHKLLRWLGPVWLVLLLVSSIILWDKGLFYQVCLVGQVGIYLLAGLATVSVWFRKTRLGGIPFYFVMSHVAMAIGLVKGLFWKQRGTWKRTERMPTFSADQEQQLTEHVS